MPLCLVGLFGRVCFSTYIEKTSYGTLSSGWSEDTIINVEEKGSGSNKKTAES